MGKPQNVTPSGLEKVRQANLRIRDPRTPAHVVSRLAASTPAIAWVIANIHGSEESGADMSLRLLYELADRTDCVATTLLDNLVILVIPVQNPDGREADTRRNAYGFDLNRDVFARTQPETDSRVEVLRTYPPVLLLDDHEFGYYRSFFPPDADPVYHEASETSVRWIEDVYGAAISRQFRKEGEVFFHGGIYDFFAPQYNDTGSTFGFGAAGMTVEVYNGAPLDRRVHRHYTVAMASLWQAANRRASVLRGLHGIFEEAVAEGRKGILERNRRYFKPNRPVRTPVPTNPVRHYFIEDATGPKGDDVRRLVRRLQRMDVEVYRLQEPLEVPDYRPYGRSARRTRLAKGTFWIPMAQSQKHWIQAILNEAPYMPTTYTYGLAGWSNPLLMSLDGGYSGAKLRPRAALMKPVKAPAARKLPSPLPKIGVYQMSVGSYAEESVGSHPLALRQRVGAALLLSHRGRDPSRRPAPPRRPRGAGRGLADSAAPIGPGGQEGARPVRERRGPLRRLPGRRREARRGARPHHGGAARPAGGRSRERRARRGRPGQPAREPRRAVRARALRQRRHDDRAERHRAGAVPHGRER